MAEINIVTMLTNDDDSFWRKRLHLWTVVNPPVIFPEPVLINSL